MANMYLHPFTQATHYVGFGARARMSLPSWVSLRGISPTLGTAKYCYLGEMGDTSDTFSRCMEATDRIYVLGHGAAGSDMITTGTAEPGRCSVEDLVFIFIQHQLPAGSRAHIRIHACHSGSGTTVRQCFAQRLSREMGEAGFINITVRGYTQAVGPYFISRLGEHGRVNPTANEYINGIIQP